MLGPLPEAGRRARVLIVGIGNALRGDDAAGLAVARRLRGRIPSGVTVIDREGDLAGLVGEWADAEAVIVIDASGPGGTPGSIARFEAHDRPLPAKSFRGSTHAFGVADAIELSRALGSLPASMIVYAIEGRSFGAGETPSPELESAVEKVVSRVLEEPCMKCR